MTERAAISRGTLGDNTAIGEESEDYYNLKRWNRCRRLYRMLKPTFYIGKGRIEM